jgi:serine/threonine protein kinase
MDIRTERAKEIFLDALAIGSAEGRRAFLDRACGEDAALRGEVEGLLAHHPQVGSFLESGAPDSPITTGPSSDEGPGPIIGPYKLLQQIGEGGMGTVFMAEQGQPVRRKVALKVIKPGMDSRQVIARFEAERQALAIMDHPNIAKVLDAGTTDAGRPYFIMELVKGIPITKYCDEHHLTPRQRLGLFLPVCQAVQHAHQKGIIHRDLKPSNVLVSLYDGKPVPKVIDFGIAKAAGQPLTDKTLVTGLGAIVGTLEYMSPEQAEVNQLDIDTRSDIYSLGVLLYELLAGSPPFTRKELEKAGVLEMLRVIREREPSKPSTRLSTAEGLATLAANRGTEPAKLTKLVRGELDWIVMKALEKDRNRRYETANGFAMDVQRYLADEPVQACPPSAGYRLRKFVRRNKGPVLAAAAVLLALLAGIIGTSTALVWAVRERDDKAKALKSERQARDQALMALRDMTDDIVERQMARGANLTDENKEFLRKIIKQFDGFAALTADDADSRAIRAEGYYRVGLMRSRLGESKDAESAFSAAVAIWKQLAADFPTRPEFRHELARSQNNLGVLLRETGRLPDAESIYGAAMAIWKQLATDFPDRPEFRQYLARTHNNMGNVFRDTGQLPKAESAFGAALEIQKQLAADFPNRPEFRQDLASSHNNLGNLLLGTGRLKEVESALNAALDIRKQLATEFPARSDLRQDLAKIYLSLGHLFQRMGRLPEAKSALDAALDIRKQLAAEFPTRPDYRRELAISHNDLGNLLNLMGRQQEWKSAVEAALDIQNRLAADFPNRPEFRRELATSHNNQGILLMSTGQLPEAESAYSAALVIQKQLDADFPNRPEFRLDLARSHYNLNILLRRMGRQPAAESALDAALDIQEQLAADFPDDPQIRQELATTFVGLAITSNERRDFQAAKGYGEVAETHQQAALKANPRNPDYLGRYRINIGLLVEANAGLLDQTAAVRAAERIRDFVGDPPGNAYFAACALSRCVPIVEIAEQATKEERDKQVRFYGDAAMLMLRDAVAKGLKDTAELRKDKNLDPLRGRDDFQKLLDEQEKKD